MSTRCTPWEGRLLRLMWSGLRRDATRRCWRSRRVRLACAMWRAWMRVNVTSGGLVRWAMAGRACAPGRGTGALVERDGEYDLPLAGLGDAGDALYLHGANEEQAEEILARLKAICEWSTGDFTSP